MQQEAPLQLLLLQFRWLLSKVAATNNVLEAFARLSFPLCIHKSAWLVTGGCQSHGDVPEMRQKVDGCPT